MNTSSSSEQNDPQSRTDEALMVSVRLKDESAFQELMRRHIRGIYNFVRKYAQSDDNASDITQETFFKLWKHANKFRIGMRFKPWIYTIARNSSLDFLKKRNPVAFSSFDNDESQVSFEETISDSSPLQDEIFHNNAVKSVLKDTVSLLEPDQEIVITMHYEQGMTFNEISKALGKPLNTVKSWHHRGIIQLRKHLSGQKTLLHQ